MSTPGFSTSVLVPTRGRVMSSGFSALCLNPATDLRYVMQGGCSSAEYAYGGHAPRLGGVPRVPFKFGRFDVTGLFPFYLCRRSSVPNNPRRGLPGRRE